MKATEFELTPRTCPMCGKEFYVPSSDWAYQNQYKHITNYFCSWKCLRAWNLKTYGDKRGFVVDREQIDIKLSKRRRKKNETH